MDFDDFLSRKNDIIQGLAYELLCELYNSDSNEPQPEWDTRVIYDVIYAVEAEINEAYHLACIPSYITDEENDIIDVPCYLTEYCNNPTCVFKKGE